MEVHTSDPEIVVLGKKAASDRFARVNLQRGAPLKGASRKFKLLSFSQTAMVLQVIMVIQDGSSLT